MVTITNGLFALPVPPANCDGPAPPHKGAASGGIGCASGAALSIGAAGASTVATRASGLPTVTAASGPGTLASPDETTDASLADAVASIEVTAESAGVAAASTAVTCESLDVITASSAVTCASTTKEVRPSASAGPPVSHAAVAISESSAQAKKPPDALSRTDTVDRMRVPLTRSHQCRGEPNTSSNDKNSKSSSATVIVRRSMTTRSFSILDVTAVPTPRNAAAI